MAVYKNDMAIGSKLFHISINKNIESNKDIIATTFDFILNDNYDIDIKTKIKGSDIILKEENNKTFKLEKNKWIQLKLQMMKSGIKINLFQSFEELEENIADGGRRDTIDDGGLKTKTKTGKYDTKVYQTNNKTIKNNNDLNIDLNNFNIIDLSFFEKYIGLVGTIIFSKNINPSEMAINSLYGIKSNKIPLFLGEIGLADVFFIFSPSLFNYQKHKFICRDSNIIGEISVPNLYQEPDTIIDYNYVYKYCNYVKNVYKLGGMVNILPLFEIFYKFTKNTNNEEPILNTIFYKLVKLIEFIIVNKDKNYLNMYFNGNFVFESLQLFLENIDEKYYQNNNDILLTLINIGYYVFDYCKERQSKTNDNTQDNIYNYFRYLLFYPKIVLKFSLDQQNKIWNFFETIKNKYKKKEKLKKNNENAQFYLSDYRKCFLTFEQINNFILLFNEKYQNEYLSENLKSIIKNIFFDYNTNDRERESLLLLVNSDIPNNHRLSDNIIISIIDIFNYYLDANNKKNILNNNKDNTIYSSNKSMQSFLSSPNYFIETILGILTRNNLSLKKVLINLLSKISQKYKEYLTTYFIGIEAENKKARKNRKKERIIKDEFYSFIQENITPNYNNQKLRELYEIFENSIISVDNTLNNDIITKERRKSTMDSVNNINSNEKNYKNDNKNEKNKKDRNKKSRSCEIKDIAGIKIKVNRTSVNIAYPGRKTEHGIEDKLLSNPNTFNLDKEIYRVSSFKKKNNNDKIEIKENKNEINEKKEQLKNQTISCEISLYLFNWLLICDKQPMHKKTSSGNISSNIISDTNSNLSDTIINFILKLLCSSKNLEVINKIVLLIMCQKGYSISEMKNINNMPFMSENYLTLLNQFSSSKTNFIQFLEELMVNSYLCLYYKEAQNKFNLVIETTSINRPYKDKIDYFKEIYEKTKEFIIDIIFNDNSYKNNIINEVITIVMCLCNGLNDINELNDENIKVRNILINLLKELLTNIIERYSHKIKEIKDNNKKIMKRYSLKDVTKTKNNDNIINEKKDEINSKHEKLIQNYAIFTSFIFEYILLIENSNVFISKILTGDSNDLVKIKNFAGIPDFLKYEINKNKEKKSIPSKIDIYLKMVDDLMESFNIENLLKIMINKKDKEKRKTIDIT